MNASHGFNAPSATVLRHLRRQLKAFPSPISSFSTPCRSAGLQPRSLCSTASQRSDLIFTFRENADIGLFRRGTQHHHAIRHSMCKAPKRRTFARSSINRQSFWSRAGTSRKTTEGGYRDDDLLPLLGLDDSSGLGGRILKPSNELKMRCTEFDENGNVVLVSGEFKKTELIAKYSLLPRDLRKIDSSVLPSILVRPSAILVNLLHIRCLVKHNRVLVFDVYGSTDSYAQSLFMYDLENKLRQRQGSLHAGAPLPYEFRALEAVLISVTNGLESEFEGVREPLIRILRDLEEDIDRDKLRHLLIYSKKLSTFEQKARLVRDAIDEILEADDDLAAMYLTEKAEGSEREEDNHEEIELLLESYYNVADEICQVSSNLVTSIKNTEEIIRAILDSNRNSLMLLDLKFSVLTLGTTVGMFIAALYGMNLENFIEESDYGFFGISGLCTLLTGAACLWGLRRLRKVQRVRISYDRANQRDVRLKARQLRRDHLRQLDSDGVVDRGLGETVAGIRSREAMNNWKREQQQRIKELSEKHTADTKRPGKQRPTDEPPVPSGA